jgi:hypothetical protein
VDVAQWMLHSGCYTVDAGGRLQTFRHRILVPSSRIEQADRFILEEGTYRLSRNFGKQLSAYAALRSKRTKTSIKWVLNSVFVDWINLDLDGDT